VLLIAGAVIMRLGRGERATIIGDLVYLAMAAFVAWAASAQGPSPGWPSGAPQAGLGYAGWHEEAARTAVDSFPDRAPRR